MDTATRKAKLVELQGNDKNVVMTGIPLRYQGQTHAKKVYKIPLDYLIYNKYNGRIGTDVLSFEKQNGALDAENERDSAIIEEFLYKSKEDRNKLTMDSLQKIGQQRYGIVTADGIIVDGNRRAMLLNRLFHKREELHYTYAQVEHCQYFFAIILPDDASEKDIQQLETIYQMGEDDKLDYDPIEKYLKCKGLKKFFTDEDIASFMGTKTSQVKEWIEILKLMEDYLDSYGYTGIYTRLEKTEGPFVDLRRYLEAYEKGTSTRSMDWSPDKTDFSDLKVICFDYIRARYEGKEFREIGKNGKDGSIFSHKDLWDSFLAEHSTKIPQDEESVDEWRKKYPDVELSRLLKKRDSDWTEKAKGQLEGNLRRYTRKLEDKRALNKPSELIERALGALQSVDCEQDSFYSDPEIKEMLKEISRISWDMKKLLERR
jgi:hypothetical protein